VHFSFFQNIATRKYTETTSDKLKLISDKWYMISDKVKILPVENLNVVIEKQITLWKGTQKIFDPCARYLFF
jgi:hypothetical protein